MALKLKTLMEMRVLTRELHTGNLMLWPGPIPTDEQVELYLNTYLDRGVSVSEMRRLVAKQRAEYVEEYRRKEQK